MKTNTLIKQFEQDLLDKINQSSLPISLIRITLELLLNKVIQAEVDAIGKEQLQEMKEKEEAQKEGERENG